MLYWITQLLQMHYHPFRVFQYITFRSILAALTALLVGLLCGPLTIRWLRGLQIGQMIRDDGPKSHLSKAGTPTMGGVLILLAITVSTLLWGDLHQRSLWVVLLVTLSFGLVGWIDDYRKLVLKNSKGLPGRWKYSRGRRRQSANTMRAPWRLQARGLRTSFRHRHSRRRTRSMWGASGSFWLCRACWCLRSAGCR